MRLLFLTPRLPYPPDRGGEIIVFNFLRELAARHDIALVTFYDRPDELAHRPTLERYCARIEMVRRPSKLAPEVMFRTVAGSSYSFARHASGEFRAAIDRVLDRWTPDLVQLNTFVMAQYLPFLRGVPTVLHMHDVAWEVWERMAGVVPWYARPLVRIEARRIRRNELDACARVGANVLVSNTDLAHLQAAAGVKVRASVILPGVDCDTLKPVDRAAESSNLVFVGSMSYIPNVDAAEYFVRDVLPLVAAEVPDVTVTIVGARPAPSVRRLAADPRVRVTGWVDEVRPYYAAAAAAIVPLRIAGGVRLKILEGLALALPMVSTTVGADGLELHDGRELLIADAPHAFAAAVVRLLRDARLRDELASRARQAAERRFAWGPVVRALEDVYDGVIRTVAA